MTTGDRSSSPTSSCLQGVFINNSYNRPSKNMATSSRFVSLNEDDINKLVSEKDSKNTVRVIKRSVQLFREFLLEKKISPNFEELSPEDLNSHLKFFVASLRKKSGENLKSASVIQVRYGLSKFLKQKCDLDLNHDDVVSSFREVYKAVLSDLKRKRFGSVQHYPPIEPEDLKKLYERSHHSFDSDTPVGLQNKVFFEIMYYLCRRGRENLREMKKDTFRIATDATGRRFVYQHTDEKDKNHKENADPNDTVGEGSMYERAGNPDCPVKSFEKYISKLNPRNNYLWHRPQDSFDPEDAVWYGNQALGKNTLGTMTSTISQRAKLSKRYTNHSIRATCITRLDDAGFESRKLMRISGHRSEMSLKSYSSRLSVQDKRIISDTLSDAALTQSCQMTTSTQAVEDLSTILSGLENSETFRSSFFGGVAEFDNNSMDSNNSQQSAVLRQSQRPFNFCPAFNNCQVTINVNNNYNES